MDGLSIGLWNVVLTLLVSTSVQGDFEFCPSNITCSNDNLILPWYYTTNETVTVIEWYKQPGVLIARIFGVNHGAPLTVLDPYTTSNGYNVTQYIDESNAQYNCSNITAAIVISGVSTHDSGIYSVNITAASPLSAVLSFNYTDDCKQTTTESITTEQTTQIPAYFEFENTSRVSCSGNTLKLLWNYTTDETVTVIEWYKQPGVLITRIFGVNIGAPFTVLKPYTTNGYDVTFYNTSGFNAAIQIIGVSRNDSGTYSVNVTAASPQSTTLYFNYTNDCIGQTTTEAITAEQTSPELTTTEQTSPELTTTEQTSPELTTTEQTLQESFIFDNPLHVICSDETLILPWNYKTKQSVTVIEWYKQPGNLIARIFGVNSGANLTVIAPYTNGYNVTRYNDPDINAAIQISGVSINDSGIYSVNVTAASPQSATLHFNYTADCMEQKQTTTKITTIKPATTTAKQLTTSSASEEGLITVKIKIIIGCCIGGGGGVIVIAIGVKYSLRKTRKRRANKMNKINSTEGNQSETADNKVDASFTNKAFSYL